MTKESKLFGPSTGKIIRRRSGPLAQSQEWEIRRHLLTVLARTQAEENAARIERSLAINREMARISRALLETNRELHQTNRELYQTNRELYQTNRELYRTNAAQAEINETLMQAANERETKFQRMRIELTTLKGQIQAALERNQELLQETQEALVKAAACRAAQEAPPLPPQPPIRIDETRSRLPRYCLDDLIRACRNTLEWAQTCSPREFYRLHAQDLWSSISTNEGHILEALGLPKSASASENVMLFFKRNYLEKTWSQLQKAKTLLDPEKKPSDIQIAFREIKYILAQLILALSRRLSTVQPDQELPQESVRLGR